MIRLISGTLPTVEFVGGYYLTTLPNEEGLYTRDQPEVQVKSLKQICQRGLVDEVRLHYGVPEEATQQERVFDEEAGLWWYGWSWYEVTAE